MGLNLGAAEHEADFILQDTTVDPGVNIDYLKDYQAPEDGTGSGRIYLGYRLGRDVALEIGYLKNAELEGDFRQLNDGGVIDPDTGLPTDYLAKETLESAANYLAIVGVWPIQQNWSVQTRFGVSLWQLDYSQKVEDNTEAEGSPDRDIRTEAYSDEGTGLLLGIAFSYGLSDSLEFQLAYDYHRVDLNFNNVDVEYTLGTVSLGAAYHF